jgi:hypothetical protein
VHALLASSGRRSALAFLELPSRPVKLSLLLKSLRNVLWRQEPVVYPERLRHSVDADGRHHLELVLEPGEVEDDLPKIVHRSGAAPTLSTANFGKRPKDGDA